MILLPKTERHRSPRHLAWIRTLPCSVPGCDRGDIQAHHVRKGAGVGIKPADGNSVPLCLDHHSEGHTSGWRTFEVRHRVDLSEIAARLWAESSTPETSLLPRFRPLTDRHTNMSDMIPSQHESAIAVLREREAQLDVEIQTHSRALELATAQRELLLDLIATLSKKPRVRAPRALARALPETAAVDLSALRVIGTLNVDNPSDPKNKEIDLSPLPTVFATPANDKADTAAVA